MNRLRIIQRLARAEASVTELIDHVGLSQPLVSWHVGKLRLAGIVETRRIGRETVCRLRGDAFREFVRRERAILGLEHAALDEPHESSRPLKPAPKAAAS